MFENKTNKTYYINNLREFKVWLEKRNLSPITVRVYCCEVRKWGNDELTTENIVNFLKANLAKYQPSSLRICRYALSSWAKFQKITIEWEMITKLIPVVQKKFFITIDELELEKLKQAKARTSFRIIRRDNLILDFLFWTGIRINELINIRHCDYSQGMLKIYGKGNKIRHVFLPPFLQSEFKPCSLKYLFSTRGGKKIGNTQVRKIVFRKVKRAGMDKHISPHTFRRSFATLLNKRECKLTTIQKLLGHSKLETTVNYIHNSYEELYADYSKLWNFSPPPPPLNSIPLKNKN